jgi:hypothetical protein
MTRGVVAGFGAGQRENAQWHCHRVPSFRGRAGVGPQGSLQLRSARHDRLTIPSRPARRSEATTSIPSSIRTWLYRIATNRSLNALRSASRRSSLIAEAISSTWVSRAK